MKIICINPDKDLKVTADKEYEIESEVSSHFQIRDNEGKLIWVFKRDFGYGQN